MEDKDRDHHHRHHRRRDSPTPMKKAQVFYYISRNGRLEQPHFLEIPLFPNHPLRLKDVLDRLAVLRGNAMPFLYSWSCKRNYKSGYVWNDLSENDVVYPAEGSEYVLKASQLVDLHASSERLQQIHITNNTRQPVQEPNLPTKTRKQQLAPSPLKELAHHPDSDLEYDEDEDYEYDDGDKHIYPTTAPSITPHSRGVSNGEPPGPTCPPTQTPTESTRFDSARCSASRRFALNNDDELGIESAPSRNSVLLQFIACGGSVGSKGKSGPGSGEAVRRTEKGIGKGVVCKMAGNMIGEEEMIKYMSENPRFGKLQTEDKEYFSGSIVESIREDRHVVPPMLKKSNSYNEEKCKREELEEKKDEDEENENDGIKGRCLPLMILTSNSSKQPKKP